MTGNLNIPFGDRAKISLNSNISFRSRSSLNMTYQPGICEDTEEVQRDHSRKLFLVYPWQAVFRL